MARGLKLRLCKNALDANKMTAADLWPGCEVVPAGLVEIVELQNKGFACQTVIPCLPAARRADGQREAPGACRPAAELVTGGQPGRKTCGDAGRLRANFPAGEDFPLLPFLFSRRQARPGHASGDLQQAVRIQDLQPVPGERAQDALTTQPGDQPGKRGRMHPDMQAAFFLAHPDGKTARRPPVSCTSRRHRRSSPEDSCCSMA